jgi:hypothetical protein
VALSVFASGTNIVVSWPNAPGFNLERKSALNDAVWTAVTNAPASSNGVKSVVLPMGPAGFFRLKR